MDQDAMRALVLESATELDGRKTITCDRAFEIHRRHDIALRQIGRICNENGIRICECQLGCFR